MLILYETPAGYALFKLTDEGKVDRAASADELYRDFETPAQANKTLKLKAFSKFENTTDALAAMTALVEGKVSKGLKAFLTQEMCGPDGKATAERLAVSDPKLATAIAKKLSLSVLSDATVNELMRGIRNQIGALLSGISEGDMNAMVLGLSHSLSRYKLKFSPDKVDTMIIQAIALLDDLDKEINTYAMRVKEWYGWHFPEIAKIVVDNMAYAKTIKAMGFRTNAATTDLSAILPEELEAALKEAAQISMGTEISDQDMENITYLCDQIISITEYRAQLYDYLKNRMAAIAPNLTLLVGELVGARLIAHAGSLMNLAKAPASTVQILGAEKALFRALKSKHDTPKYGLLYHASLVGQAGPKIKGKIARVVATKAALAIRCDALGEAETPDVGLALRSKVEARLRQLEGKAVRSAHTSAVKPKPAQKKFEFKPVSAYNTAADAPAPVPAPALGSKRKAVEDVPAADASETEAAPKKVKKEKKDKKDKKDKKADKQASKEEVVEADGEKKKKKKKKSSSDE